MKTENRSSVTLIYGDKKRRRQRRKKPCAPGALRGEGAKPVPKQPAGFPSGTRTLPSPAKSSGKDAKYRSGFRTTAFRPEASGPSSTHLSAQVELSSAHVVPVEQVTRKRKATSPLPPRQSSRPTDPTSPTRWEFAHSRIKGRFKNYITPSLERRHRRLASFSALTAAPKGNGQGEHWAGGRRWSKTNAHHYQSSRRSIPASPCLVTTACRCQVLPAY